MSAYRRPAEREPEPKLPWLARARIAWRAAGEAADGCYPGGKADPHRPKGTWALLGLLIPAAMVGGMVTSAYQACVPHPLPVEPAPKACRIEPFYKGDFHGSYCEPGQTLEVVGGTKVCQCPKAEVLP